MMLGMKNSEVKLVPYESKWAQEFQKTQLKISQSTGLPSEQIEHIGSTAIKGILSKPMIDILIGVDSIVELEDDFFQQLSSLGFYKLKVKKENEIILAKFTDNAFEFKSHIIHLVDYRQTIWQHLLFFRNRLNNDEGLRQEYEVIKQDFFQSNNTDIKAYTLHKEGFVRHVLANFKRSDAKITDLP